jgi:nucleotide-binding universal stress UspA family protein
VTGPALRRIVVGVDGSPDAARALDWAITLARATGAHVVAVHALGLLDRLGDDRVAAGSHRAAITAEFTDRWCAALDSAGVTADRTVVDGPPADVILRTARAEAADLVVLGERGVGGTAAELGSTSRRVLAATTVPVLVVPPGPDDGSPA